MGTTDLWRCGIVFGPQTHYKDNESLLSRDVPHFPAYLSGISAFEDENLVFYHGVFRRPQRFLVKTDEFLHCYLRHFRDVSPFMQVAFWLKGVGRAGRLSNVNF